MVVKYVLTGFGEFQDVPINPSMIVVNRVAGLSSDTCKIRSSIVEVSMEGVHEALKELRQPNNLLPSPDTNKDQMEKNNKDNDKDGTDKEIWVHVGVNSQQSGFRLEKIAWNEKNFRIPDQRGAQPQHEAIDDKAKIPSIQTNIDLDSLCNDLSNLGFQTETSTDPGRFLCNYIYYHTLDYCAKNNTCGLFVHIPPFSAQSLDSQISFIRKLLELLPNYIASSNNIIQNNIINNNPVSTSPIPSTHAPASSSIPESDSIW